MKHYPHHIGDFDRATRHLSRIERSVYRDLMDLYYDTEAPLPLDIDLLCRKILAKSNEEVTAVEQTLNEFFTRTERGWWHERCEEVIDCYRANTTQKSVAGKASALKKQAKRQRALNGCSTDDSTDVVTDVERQINGTSTNHKPITNNHKPSLSTKAPAVVDAELFPNVDQKVISDFKALRKAKKAPISATAMQTIAEEAKRAGMTLEQALVVCCARGWQGFKAEWIAQAQAGPASARGRPDAMNLAGLDYGSSAKAMRESIARMTPDMTPADIENLQEF